MLGDAIAESGGAELLDQVEALRKAAIAYRGRPTPARRRRVTELVASFDVDRAEDVIRAFTCYFQLVNLAEERHRVRTLRERSRSGKPVGDSIAALDADPASVRDLRITPVLTAHPTEAKRRAVVEHLWRIGALLEQLEDRSLGVSEEQEIERRMREEIAGLWRTDPIRRHRPEPLDEVRAVLALFDQTIFTTLPAVYREMDRRLDPDGCGYAAAVVRTVPSMGHVGRRRSRRQPTCDGRGDAGSDGHPIRPRAAGVGGRLQADRSDALGLGEGRASEPRAPPGVGP